LLRIPKEVVETPKDINGGEVTNFTLSPCLWFIWKYKPLLQNEKYQPSGN